MNAWRDILQGRGEDASWRRYVGWQAVIYWGLIMAAWLSYPAEHHFSILTHTFSFLGSFNPEHNPRWWWIFSTAQVLWGITEIPVVFFLCRWFAGVSRWGAALAAFGLWAGCVGIVLVGFIPDVRDLWAWGWRYTDVHTLAALLVAAGFGFGLAVLGFLTGYGWLRSQGQLPALRAALRRVAKPLLFWLCADGTCVFMVLRWEGIYAGMKAAAVTAGRPIGSSWAEGLKTWYAFPLWENLAIYALYVTMTWLACAVARSGGVTSRRAESREVRR